MKTMEEHNREWELSGKVLVRGGAVLVALGAVPLIGGESVMCWWHYVFFPYFFLFFITFMCTHPSTVDES